MNWTPVFEFNTSPSNELKTCKSSFTTPSLLVPHCSITATTSCLDPTWPWQSQWTTNHSRVQLESLVWIHYSCWHSHPSSQDWFVTPNFPSGKCGLQTMETPWYKTCILLLFTTDISAQMLSQLKIMLLLLPSKFCDILSLQVIHILREFLSLVEYTCDRWHVDWMKVMEAFVIS